MEPLAEAALALLLTANAPGASPYSKVAIADCDEVCQETPQCDEPKLVCAKPHYVARERSWYRYENWAEGTRRYLTIAEAMARASRDMVWSPEGDCARPGTADPDDGPACTARRRARPWVGSERLLQVVLATVASHESGLRRDVHEGKTRGDCDYTTRNGKRVIIAGSCRSSCLGQINLPHPDDETRRGHGRDDLVGLDEAATFRCVEAMVDRLSHARQMCIRRNNGVTTGRYAACTFGVYGGVAAWSSDPRIKDRVKTFQRLWSTSRKVDQEVHDALDDE